MLQTLDSHLCVGDSYGVSLHHIGWIFSSPDLQSGQMLHNVSYFLVYMMSMN